MKTFDILFRSATLIQLVAYYAAATPLLARPGSAPSLTLLQSATLIEHPTHDKNSTGALQAPNISPNPIRPPNPFDYRVPFSEIVVLFHSYYDVSKNRQEEWVAEAVWEATRDVVSHYYEHTHPMGTEERQYSSDDPMGIDAATDLWLEPKPDLTWDMWSNVLTGIKYFTHRYPGWDYGFLIWRDESKEEEFVGSGRISTR